MSVFAQELETCVKAVHGVSGQVHTGRGSLRPSLPRSWKPALKLCMGSVGCLAWAGGDKGLSPCQPVICAFSRSATSGAPLYSPLCC